MRNAPPQRSGGAMGSHVNLFASAMSGGSGLIKIALKDVVRLERKKQRKRDARAAKSRKKMQQLVDASGAHQSSEDIPMFCIRRVHVFRPHLD